MLNSNLLSMEEMNQYTFYSIPKELFENKEFEQLSIKARLLYTLMLDRLNYQKNINGLIKKSVFTFILLLKVLRKNG